MKKILLLVSVIFMAFIISNAQDVNYALQISADGTYFECLTFMDFSTADFTFEAWIMLDASTEVENYTGVVDGRYGGTGGGEQKSKALIFKTINEKLTLSYEFEGDWGYEDADGLNEVAKGEWQHVALVVDGTAKTATFYVNGNQGSTDNTYANLGNEISWDSLFIANSNKSDDRTLIGLIDELRVWGIARTEAEIQENMYHEIDPSTPGLLAYYSFNEGFGTTLTDGTGNGNDANLFPENSTDYFFVPDPDWVTSVSDINDVSGISTYPNPVKDMLNFKGIELRNPEMRIYDVTGRLIVEKVIGNNSIDVTYLETGLYFFEIKQGKDLYQGRFIKE